MNKPRRQQPHKPLQERMLHVRGAVARLHTEIEKKKQTERERERNNIFSH